MRRSRLSKKAQEKLIELFVGGSTARTASAIAGVNKTTAAYYFKRLRILIFEHCEKQSAEYLTTKSKSMKALLAVSAKANVVRVLLGK